MSLPFLPAFLKPRKQRRKNVLCHTALEDAHPAFSLATVLPLCGCGSFTCTLCTLLLSEVPEFRDYRLTLFLLDTPTSVFQGHEQSLIVDESRGASREMPATFWAVLGTRDSRDSRKLPSQQPSLLPVLYSHEYQRLTQVHGSIYSHKLLAWEKKSDE